MIKHQAMVYDQNPKECIWYWYSMWLELLGTDKLRSEHINHCLIEKKGESKETMQISLLQLRRARHSSVESGTHD